MPPADAACGLDVRPFAATRYGDPARLRALTSPAYDLIDPAERALLAGADEHSIVHLTLPTFGAGEAARRLALWRGEGVLRTDPVPALFVYDLAGPGPLPSTRGWIGAVTLPGPISPHEATVPAVVADRLGLLTATAADLEPIVLTHDGGPAAADDLARHYAATAGPIIDVTDDSGVRHRIWRVDEPAHVAAVRADMAGRRAVIADGHHRYASAQAHRAARGGAGPWDRVLALLVPTGVHGPRVQAIHRVVPGLSLTRAAATAAELFGDSAPRPAAQAEVLLATAPDTLVLLTDGTGCVGLTRPDRERLLGPDRPRAWHGLDVALVDAGLIESTWNGAGPVVLRHRVDAAVAAARESSGVAVLLRPTPAATVLDLAAQGILMPRKSTFFVPKPRTGLLLRCFADEPDH